MFRDCLYAQVPSSRLKNIYETDHFLKSINLTLNYKILITNYILKDDL
jgi:hypothetical protein